MNGGGERKWRELEVGMKGRVLERKWATLKVVGVVGQEVGRA